MADELQKKIETEARNQRFQADKSFEKATPEQQQAEEQKDDTASVWKDKYIYSHIYYNNSRIIIIT